jgi:protein tyrosine phosphatase (PTP) superfamily phosphohydrolase (DUF442 family)
MRERLLWTLWVSALCTFCGQGCQSCGTPCAPADSCAECRPAHRMLAFLQPHPLTPAYPAPAPVIVPQPAPITGASPIPAPSPPVSSPVPVDARGYPPGARAPDPTWRPPASSAPPAPSWPSTGEPPRDPVRLYPPSSGAVNGEASPSDAAVKEDRSRPAALEAPKQPIGGQSPSTSPLPVGIPQFAAVRDQVSAGLKPLVDGGLEWLEANRYKTVLHVHAPGQDDSADRQQVEKHGMKYVSLEVSPQTLSKTIVDQFDRQVSDPLNYPLFVYDQDGSLAGGLWYLHFRNVDRLSDSAARTRAQRLGLRDDPNGAHAEMWLAIQKFLSAPGDR